MKNASCHHDNVPKYVKDPYVIWDDFPCPPPWNKEILFKLDYRRKLPPEDGLHIILQIAKRCDVPVPDLHVATGRLAGDRYFARCSTTCSAGVVATCATFFVFMLVIVIFLLRRQCVVTRRQNNLLSKRCDCSLCEAEHLFRDGNCTLKRHSFSGHSGRYTKRGATPHRTLSKKSAMFDETDFQSTLLENSDTYKQFPRISPDLESLRYDFHIYETLDRYNSRIDEFTLLRKAFRKYYGRDIDFSVSPSSKKTTESDSSRSDKYSSGSLCLKQAEVVCVDGKNISKVCCDKLDYNRCSNIGNKSRTSSVSDESYSIKQGRNKSTEELLHNGFSGGQEDESISNADFRFSIDPSATYSSLKRQRGRSKNSGSIFLENSEHERYKLTYSDESDSETIVTTFHRKRKSSLQKGNETIPFLRIPRTYERLTSTTSTRTDTTTISDDSLDAFEVQKEKSLTFQTFR